MLKFVKSEALDPRINANNISIIIILALKSAVCLKVNYFQIETVNNLNRLCIPNNVLSWLWRFLVKYPCH